jgi:hypothetical protein
VFFSKKYVYMKDKPQIPYGNYQNQKIVQFWEIIPMIIFHLIINNIIQILLFIGYEKTLKKKLGGMHYHILLDLKHCRD